MPVVDVREMGVPVSVVLGQMKPHTRSHQGGQHRFQIQEERRSGPNTPPDCAVRTGRLVTLLQVQ